MIFFDVNILYGVPSQKKIYEPIPNIEILSDKLKEFGIDKAIVRREEQFFASPVIANRLLAEDLRRSDSLCGVWTMLPLSCNEMPPEDKLLLEMKKSRIVGWQFFPKQNGYIFHRRVLKNRFEMAEQSNIPIFIDFAFVSEHDLFDVMDEYPKLTVILRNANVWPSDRILRPFLSEFPNAYMELSNYLTSDGIEALVNDNFSGKILFSTHFQASHAGGPMMMLKHAGISENQKKQVASGNIEKILEKINYDK